MNSILLFACKSLLPIVLKNFPYYIPCITILFILISCSEEKSVPPLNPPDPNPTAKTDRKDAFIDNKLEFPSVYVEELDQSQEFYKEQHETSFSFVTKKNWFSYTSGKDGILTKILLFGRPNFQPSDHYGDSMHGFLREGNPDTGPKYGEWNLSRDDIVNQIASQNLEPRDAGWITIRMRGEIPQISGKTYFFVCEKITGSKPWFGAFAFGEANPYKPGKFWLHPQHDLVFRTYVGKTPQQLSLEQKNIEIIEDLGLNENRIPQNPNVLPTPLPVSQSSANEVVIQKIDNESKSENNAEGTLGKNSNNFEKSADIPEENNKIEKIDLITTPSINLDDKNSSKDQKSLFNRLFKRE